MTGLMFCSSHPSTNHTVTCRRADLKQPHFTRRDLGLQEGKGLAGGHPAEAGEEADLRELRVLLDSQRRLPPRLCTPSPGDAGKQDTGRAVTHSSGRFP